MTYTKTVVIYPETLKFTDDFGTGTAGIGTDTINLDTNKEMAQQAQTETFIVPDVPAGSPDGNWHKLRFWFTYSHTNKTVSWSSVLDDGSWDIYLRKVDDPDYVQLRKMQAKEISGVWPKTFTGTDYQLCYDVEPGEYYFILSQPNAGDGEELTLTVGNISATERDITCFTAGVMIDTDAGPRPVETLQVGDRVLTLDRGFKPIRWIGSTRVGLDALKRKPKLRPIRIRAGSLGHNTPGSDLIVSREHRILVRSAIAQRMFGASEVLVAAKHLLELAGVELCETVTEVDYFHLLLDQHEIIHANGTAAESLYTGPQALKSMCPKARDEILTLFPQLRTRFESEKPEGSRPFIPGRKARHLVSRHIKHARMLCAQF